MRTCCTCGIVLEYGFVKENGSEFCYPCHEEIFDGKEPEEVIDKHDQKEIEQDEYSNGGDNEND